MNELEKIVKEELDLITFKGQKINEVDNSLSTINGDFHDPSLDKRNFLGNIVDELDKSEINYLLDELSYKAKEEEVCTLVRMSSKSHFDIPKKKKSDNIEQNKTKKSLGNKPIPTSEEKKLSEKHSIKINSVNPFINFNTNKIPKINLFLNTKEKKKEKNEIPKKVKQRNSKRKFTDVDLKSEKIKKSKNFGYIKRYTTKTLVKFSICKKDEKFHKSAKRLLTTSNYEEDEEEIINKFQTVIRKLKSSNDLNKEYKENVKTQYVKIYL